MADQRDGVGAGRAGITIDVIDRSGTTLAASLGERLGGLGLRQRRVALLSEATPDSPVLYLHDLDSWTGRTAPPPHVVDVLVGADTSDDTLLAAYGPRLVLAPEPWQLVRGATDPALAAERIAGVVRRHRRRPSVHVHLIGDTDGDSLSAVLAEVAVRCRVLSITAIGRGAAGAALSWQLGLGLGGDRQLAWLDVPSATGERRALPAASRDRGAGRGLQRRVEIALVDVEARSVSLSGTVLHGSSSGELPNVVTGRSPRFDVARAAPSSGRAFTSLPVVDIQPASLSVAHPPATVDRLVVDYDGGGRPVDLDALDAWAGRSLLVGAGR